MADENKKGITVKIDAALHAQVKEYIESRGMTMHQPPGLRKEILYRIHHSGRASPPKSHRKSIEPI